MENDAVVTSPLHSRRACATFEAVGFKVVCAPAGSREYVVPGALAPEDRLATFPRLIYEKFAAATYKSNGCSLKPSQLNDRDPE